MKNNLEIEAGDQTIKNILCLPAPKQALMPPRPLTAAQIQSLTGVSKLREFNVLATAGKCLVWQSKSYPYKGQWKTWAKWTNDAYITSYATVSANMVTIHHAGAPDIMRRSPAGMEFAADDNGVLLRRISDGMDFHPSLSDWMASDFAARAKRMMAHNYKRRQEQKKNKKESDRMEKLFQRDLKTTRVTLIDSRLAGNCIEGSLAFAERKLGIDRKEILSAGYLFSYPADKLIAKTNGNNTAQATAAARVAWRRETMVAI